MAEILRVCVTNGVTDPGSFMQPGRRNLDQDGIVDTVRLRWNGPACRSPGLRPKLTASETSITGVAQKFLDALDRANSRAKGRMR